MSALDAWVQPAPSIGIGHREPPSLPARNPITPLRVFSFIIGRAMGTVLVTTHGVLDPDGSQMLDRALRDLIEDQGNLSLIIDLIDLSVSEPSCLGVFVEATASAAKRGGEVALADPCQAVRSALTLLGLAGSITLSDRRSSPRIPPAYGSAPGPGLRGGRANDPTRVKQPRPPSHQATPLYPRQ